MTMNQHSRAVCLRRLHPDDRILGSEWPVAGLQGDLQLRADRERPGKAKQEARSADVSRPSLEGWRRIILPSAQDSEFYSEFQVDPQVTSR